jgi:hypothetical protein
MIIKMQVSYEESKALISEIDHPECQKAMLTRWISGGPAGVKAQSICWLYCWAAATGMGSAKAKKQAGAAFNAIFNRPYNSFAHHAMREYAENTKHRYADGDIEDEFAAVAAASLIIKPNI